MNKAIKYRHRFTGRVCYLIDKAGRGKAVIYRCRLADGREFKQTKEIFENEWVES